MVTGSYNLNLDKMIFSYPDREVALKWAREVLGIDDETLEKAERIYNLSISDGWDTLSEDSSYEKIASSVGSYDLFPASDKVTWYLQNRKGDLVTSHRVVLSNGKYQYQIKRI